MQKHLTIWISLMVLSAALFTESQSAKSSQARLSKRFNDGTSAKNIPFELNSNKAYVRTHINNAGPYWFLLDSGAAFNVVDLDCAKALGITISGNSEARGGAGSITSAVGTDVLLGLPGVQLSKQNVVVIPLNSAISAAEGRGVDGLLGYDFFKQFVVKIDYDRQRVSVYEPQTYTYIGGAGSIPLIIDGEHAFISTTLVLARGKRITGKFLIDTAWRSALTLTRPFVEKNELRTSLTKRLEATTGWGVGGPTTDTVARAESLKLGVYTLRNFVTNLSTAKTGVLGTGDFAGIIGGEMLRRFNVILDYSRSRMILEPNEKFADVFKFDMSGMFLRADGGDFKTFKIYEVIRNSPAARSGLREGDIIEAINRRPATDMTLEQIRQLFKQRAGAECWLTVRRGDNRFRVRIRLRKLI